MIDYITGHVIELSLPISLAVSPYLHLCPANSNLLPISMDLLILHISYIDKWNHVIHGHLRLVSFT